MKVEISAGVGLQLRMLNAVIEWLRNEPVGPAGPFSGLKDFGNYGQPAHPDRSWKGRLDNDARFVFEFETVSVLQGTDPISATFELQELFDSTSVIYKGRFEQVTLPSGNKWLRFVKVSQFRTPHLED